MLRRTSRRSVRPAGLGLEVTSPLSLLHRIRGATGEHSSWSCVFHQLATQVHTGKNASGSEQSGVVNISQVLWEDADGGRRPEKEDEERVKQLVESDG